MSLLHLFSHFFIKAGAKEDSTVCLLFCFTDKMWCSMPVSSEFALDVGEDIRGDIFTCDVQKKRKVSEAPLNISTTLQYRAKLTLGYICKAQMSSVTEKQHDTLARICV